MFIDDIIKIKKLGLGGSTPPPPSGLLKPGWYYAPFNGSVGVLVHFNLEKNCMYQLSFSLSDLSGTYADMSGAFTAYTLSGNTITCDNGTELGISDEGVLTYSALGLTFDYTDELDVDVFRS